MEMAAGYHVTERAPLIPVLFLPPLGGRLSDQEHLGAGDGLETRYTHARGRLTLSLSPSPDFLHKESSSAKKARLKAISLGMMTRYHQRGWNIEAYLK